MTLISRLADISLIYKKYCPGLTPEGFLSSLGVHGLDEPQGVGYVPQTHEIFVANGGDGDCNFYNASTFQKTATVHLSSDADDVRYDSASHSEREELQL